MYERRLSKTKPYLKEDKITYYKDIFFGLDGSIFFNPGEASCYAKKADYLLEASSDGLKEEFFVKDSKVEKLYRRAISLCPLNFEYYLKLGWFYAGKDDPRSKIFLLKSQKLYPTEYQVYLSLYRYYLAKKIYKKAFSSLVSALYYGMGESYKFLPEVKNELEEIPQLVLNRKRRQVILVMQEIEELIDFKKEGFSNIRLPFLEIKIYAKAPIKEPVVYVNDSYYGTFKPITFSNGFNIYKFKIKDFPSDIYLDSFRIRIATPLLVEKVEFTARYY